MTTPRQPSPTRTPTPTDATRQRTIAGFMANGYKQIGPDTWQDPTGGLWTINGNGTERLIPQPTATRVPTQTPRPTETNYEKATNNIIVRNLEKSMETPSPTSTPTDASLHEQWLTYFSATRNNFDKTTKGLQQVVPKDDPAFDTTSPKDTWQKVIDYNVALGERPPSLRPEPKQAEGYQYGPPTSDLSKPQPPDVLDSAEQQQILGQSPQDVMQPQSQRRPGQNGTQGGTAPYSVPSMPEWSRPLGTQQWTMPGTGGDWFKEDPSGDPRLGQWMHNAPQTGSTTYWSQGQYGPPWDQQPWSESPYGFRRGGRIRQTPGFMPQQQPDMPMPSPMEGGPAYMAHGGGLTLRGPAHIVDDATGQPIASLAEVRPEQISSRPGGFSVANHVPGMPRYDQGGQQRFATGGSFQDALNGYFTGGGTDNPADTNFQNLFTNNYQDINRATYTIPGQTGTYGPTNRLYSAPAAPAPPAPSTAPSAGWTAPPVGGTPSPPDAILPDSGQAGITASPSGSGGSGAPPIFGSPPVAQGGSPPTAPASGGFNFAGYSVPGFTAPGSSPFAINDLWGGSGSIPMGINPNLLAQDWYKTQAAIAAERSGIQSGASGFQTAMDAIRRDLLAREQAAANDPAEAQLQHTRDTYDPYYGRAGLAKPTDITPAAGTFGVPGGTAPGGEGFRWKLQTPQESYDSVNQPLSLYEALTQHGITNAQDALTQREQAATTQYDALKSMNPGSMGLKAGEGLVTPQQLQQEQADDAAALLRARQGAKPGTMGTVTLPSGTTVTFMGGQTLTAQQQANDDAALLRARMGLEEGQIGSITLPSGTVVTYAGAKPKAETGGTGGTGGSAPPPIRPPASAPPTSGSGGVPAGYTRNANGTLQRIAPMPPAQGMQAGLSLFSGDPSTFFGFLPNSWTAVHSYTPGQALNVPFGWQPPAGYRIASGSPGTSPVTVVPLAGGGFIHW